MIVVRHCPELQLHLGTWEVDGATVAGSLFAGGRLCYPGRSDIEQQLGGPDPYTIAHEARVLEGGPSAEILLLANLASSMCSEVDPTLDLLWASHDAFWSSERRSVGPSLDRLVASLVAVEALRASLWTYERRYLDAAAALIGWMHSAGLPPNELGLEELFDGAAPACVSLGLVEL